MDIPPGFYKVYEREMKFDYTIPEYIPIPESKKIAVETLDNIIFDIFGIHFLEARGFPTVIPKIKQYEKITMGRHQKNLNEITSFA
jgi:hypothetical protein